MNKISYIPVMLVALLASTNVSAKGSLKDKSFRHSFHHAKNVHRFEKANGYTEYDFMMKGHYVAAFYNEAGKLVETDFSIAYKELPEKMKAFIQEKFSNPVVTDIERVEYSQNNCYKVRLEVNGNEYSLVSNSEGEVTMGY